MQFASPLEAWDFDRREKRFFMFGKGEGQVAHCPNTGSLRGVLGSCRKLWVSDHGPGFGATRTLRYTAEICELHDGTMVGIHTGRANRLAEEALGRILGDWLEPGAEVRREAVFGPGTRFDLKAGDVWIEVKTTTLTEGRVGMFPDAVTERGKKHLEVLAGIAKGGGKALQVYLVQRSDVDAFAPAVHIDPAYGAALKAAISAGVRVVAVRCAVTPTGIAVEGEIPVTGV